MLSDNIWIDGGACFGTEDRGQEVFNTTRSSKILFHGGERYEMALGAMVRTSNAQSPCLWGSTPLPEGLDFRIFFIVGLTHRGAQEPWLGQ